MINFYLENLIFCNLILFSYFLGSLNMAKITCKCMNLKNPSVFGSINLGMTNVLRIGSKKATVITFLGEFLKAYSITILSKFYLDYNNNQIIYVGLALILGNIYPIILRFKGGKGICNFIGFLYAYETKIGLIFIFLWLVIFFATSYSSLSSIITFTVTLLNIYLHNDILFIPLIAIFFLIIGKHLTNIKRMIRKKEETINLFRV